MNVWLLQTLGISLLLVTLVGCESPEAADSRKPVEPAVGMVTVVIDFNGRGENKEMEMACESDSTVFSILEQLQRAQRLRISHSGSGESVFISEIDGVANEQAAGDNWTYRVNDELGDRSCGVFPVKSGDQILWRFGSYP